MMMSRGVIYEEVSIYRQSDSSHSQASRSRNAGDLSPTTSKWPYPDPTPGGTPTCSKRFPILL